MEHQDIQHICDQIKELLNPQKIILFNMKSGESGKPSAFKLCVIADVEDTIKAESLVYLKIDSEIPFDVLVYKTSEWRALLVDPHSFATRIAEKGTIIYE